MAILTFVDVDSLKALLSWLTSPSIIPWVGVVAAVVAALTVETRTWFNSPSRSIKRVVLVALIWFLVAWLLNTCCQRCGNGLGGHGSGNGSGRGSSKSSTDGTNQSGKTDGKTPIKVPTKETDSPGSLPEEKRIILAVEFVPLVDDPRIAQDFACDLVQRTSHGEKRISIRASDMLEFDKLLVQELRNLSVPSNVAKPAAVIYRSPFPGEGTLRRVKQKLEIIIPKISTEFDK